jgi:polynucleotide 5'-hydroxyl-kinase GRC3/NOL9
VPLDIPARWKQELPRITARPATCLVLGEVDTGKSTFCALLASAAFSATGSLPEPGQGSASGGQAGSRVAVVDADIGQSDIGPPACVSFGILQGPIEALEQVPPLGADFVGATSPVGRLLQTATATAIVTRAARSADADFIVIDTTGLVHGESARVLKAAKVALVDPDMIIALQRENEIEHLLAPYSRRSRPAVVRLPVSRAVEKKTWEERKARRERKFAQQLAHGKPVEFSLRSLPVEGSFWVTGNALPGHWVSHLEEVLGCSVLYAERSDQGILAIVDQADADTMELVRRRANQAGVLVRSTAEFKNLLAGLLDDSGATLDIGVTLNMDFRKQAAVIHTGLDTAAKVACLRLGYMRLAPDGREIPE